MDTPTKLIFVHRIDTITSLSLAECTHLIQQFKPTLDAPIQITIEGCDFVMRYGGQAQLQLWVIGTVNPVETHRTHIQAQIGIANNQSTTRLIGGLSILVLMMILAEALSQEMEWDTMFHIVALFFAGFWILLIGGMLFSQHRLKRDLLQTLNFE